MKSAAAKNPKSEPKPGVYLRVRDDGSLTPADQFSSNELRLKDARRGSVLRVVASNEAVERDYQQFKKAHALGTLLVLNIEGAGFEAHVLPNGKIDSHAALKHLQALSGVECDSQSIVEPTTGECLLMRIPRSLAFDKMPEVRFNAAYSGWCEYIRRTWWNDLDEASISSMASLLGMGSA